MIIERKGRSSTGLRKEDYSNLKKLPGFNSDNFEKIINDEILRAFRAGDDVWLEIEDDLNNGISAISKQHFKSYCMKKKGTDDFKLEIMKLFTSIEGISNSGETVYTDSLDSTNNHKTTESVKLIFETFLRAVSDFISEMEYEKRVVYRTALLEILSERILNFPEKILSWELIQIYEDIFKKMTDRVYECGIRIIENSDSIDIRNFDRKYAVEFSAEEKQLAKIVWELLRKREFGKVKNNYIRSASSSFYKRLKKDFIRPHDSTLRVDHSAVSTATLLITLINLKNGVYTFSENQDDNTDYFWNFIESEERCSFLSFFLSLSDSEIKTLLNNLLQKYSFQPNPRKTYSEWWEKNSNRNADYSQRISRVFPILTLQFLLKFPDEVHYCESVNGDTVVSMIRDLRFDSIGNLERISGRDREFLNLRKFSVPWIEAALRTFKKNLADASTTPSFFRSLCCSWFRLSENIKDIKRSETIGPHLNLSKDIWNQYLFSEEEFNRYKDAGLIRQSSYEYFQLEVDEFGRRCSSYWWYGSGGENEFENDTARMELLPDILKRTLYGSLPSKMFEKIPDTLFREVCQRAFKTYSMSSGAKKKNFLDSISWAMNGDKNENIDIDDLKKKVKIFVEEITNSALKSVTIRKIFMLMRSSGTKIFGIPFDEFKEMLDTVPHRGIIDTSLLEAMVGGDN